MTGNKLCEAPTQSVHTSWLFLCLVLTQSRTFGTQNIISVSYSVKFSASLSGNLLSGGCGLSSGDGRNCDWLVVTTTGSCCGLPLGWMDFFISLESNQGCLWCWKWKSSLHFLGLICMTLSNVVNMASDDMFIRQSTSQDTGPITLTTSGNHFSPWLKFLTFTNCNCSSVCLLVMIHLH